MNAASPLTLGPCAAVSQAEVPHPLHDRPAADPYRQLLMLRVVLVNLVGAALLLAVWHQGWIARIVTADESRIVLVIGALFLASLVWSLRRAAEIAFELDQARCRRPAPGSRAARFLRLVREAPSTARGSIETALRLELAASIAPVRHLGGILVLLGLIGTVLGFIIALSGIDPDASTDVSAIGPMVSSLITGLGVALYTTLVGAVLNLWVMTNYRLLESGATRLLSRLLERGAGSPTWM